MVVWLYLVLAMEMRVSVGFNVLAGQRLEKEGACVLLCVVGDDRSRRAVLSVLFG
jgi:hypothetical protein